MTARQTRIVPPEWMPPARGIARIVLHWTAGAYHASEPDREHYHLLVEGDGRLVRGDHTIADNVSTADGVYAAHTRGCNTGSVGIAVCCMGGAMERPAVDGPWPMRAIQWQRMLAAAADLCERYGIPVTPETVLGHGEVEARLGIPQRGKWDPMRLPWSPRTPPERVGELLRAEVRRQLRTLRPEGRGRPVQVWLQQSAARRVLLSDDGWLDDEGRAWVPLRAVAEALGGSVASYTAGRGAQGPVAVVVIGEEGHRLDVVNRGGRGYVRARDLPGVAAAYDPEGPSVTLARSG